MKKTNKRTASSEKMVTLAILTALVIVLQSFSSVAARIGLFSFALGGLPVAIGAVLYGNRAGLWLGAIFGIIVLATDATAFALYGVNLFATIFVVLLKSVASGFAMAVVFAFVYEKYGSVKAPIIAHISANVAAIFATHYELFDWVMADQMRSGLFTVACAAIAASMYVFIQRMEDEI